MTQADQELTRSIRAHLWGAGLFLCALLLFIFGWFAWMQISGAVIASGSIAVESNVKTVNHREGGIVAEILVDDGDQVKANDVLLRLDDTEVRSNLTALNAQLDELLATEARLVAERDQQDAITFPQTLLQRAETPHIAGILDGQKRLLQARSAGLAGRIEQFEEQIKQLQSQVDGLDAQAEAKKTEIDLLQGELDSFATLLENAIVSSNQVNRVRREKARLEGEQGELLTDKAAAGLSISERRLQILQLREDYQADVLQQLQEARSEIARLQEQRTIALDQLERMEILAPQSGRVHQLAVHTQGSTITSAEPVLLLVPEDDALIIEAQVLPNDIDQLYIGQKAIIRLPGFDLRTTPELAGHVRTISAETTQDPMTGIATYTVRLQLDDGEKEKLGTRTLLPGMPVEALIKTNERSILSYLVKPMTDHIARAFREE